MEIFATAICILAAWILASINRNLKLSCISRAVEELALSAEQTVLELQQTLVDDMKAKGKLTSSDIKNLRISLLKKTKEKTSRTSLSILENADINIDALISGAGEATIERIKRV